MSTTNTTSGLFNQAGMNAYNQLQPGFASTISSYMNNPFSNPFFQTQQQMGTNQANMMGQTGMSNITRNMSLSGMGGANNPALLEMLNNQSRANSQNRAQLGFLNPVQNALGMQQFAMGQAGGYRPLQTGQQQKQSGLGQFAPLLGMGLSLATGGLMGGGGAGGGGGFPGGGSINAMNSLSSNMPSPWMSPSPFGYSAGMGQNAPNVGGYNFGSSPFMMGQPQ